MNIFKPYISKWQLTVDGMYIITNSSKLLPVIYQNKLAILKIPLIDEEKIGATLLKWWHGNGAAKVFAEDNSAYLIERSTSKNSLVEMAQIGQDNEATKIIIDVIAKLHSCDRVPIPSHLTTLTQWFGSLKNAAINHGGLFK